MKIAFFMNNEKYSGRDLTNPMKGNPGIGGTEYMIWTISYYLNKLYDDIKIVMFAPIIENLAKDIQCIKCETINESIKKANENNVDILVLRGPINDIDIYDKINRYKMKTILWNHNFETSQALKYANDCKYVVRNICVSKEQYDKLRDHNIFSKSMYIYNALDLSIYNKSNCGINDKENIVCYMGSLVPDKGFHILARNWKKILERVPDAQLIVVGSGKLYNDSAKMGKFNITDSRYEDMFMPYLLDNNGKILKSVKFMGVAGGQEKIELMNKSKVGVANPSGIGETFCIVAVEFQALGIPVVSKRKYALLDTIQNKRSGLLINSDKEFVNAIVELLNNNNKNLDYGKNGSEFVRDKFDIYKICELWRKTFIDIMSDKPVKVEYKTNNYLNNGKWLREINRYVSKVFPNNYSVIEWNAKFINLKNKL